MSDLNKLTIAEARDALRRGETTAVKLTNACLSAIEGSSALGAFVHNTPILRLPAPRPQISGSNRAMRPPFAVFLLGSKTCSAPKGSRAKPRQKFCQAFGLNMNRLSQRNCAMQARSCWANSIWMSLPWGRPTKPLFTGQRSTRGARTAAIKT